jgi:hypothetical protein
MPWLLFTTEGKTQYLLDKMLSWPQNHSEHCDEEKNPALLGIEPWSSSPQISLYTD